VQKTDTIAQIGESAALLRTIARLNLGVSSIVGPGDDAAVVASPDGRFVVTTDTMIEDHDFRLDWSSAFDLGYKAIATNVSDVAAMGAKPTALTVALAVPSDTTVAWLEDFADGLRAGCEALAPGAAVVGGDLAGAPKIFIAITAHGDLEGRDPVLRSGAKPGDVLAVAGTLGRAAAGLALLQFEDAEPAAAFDELVDVQLRPQPPIAAGVLAAKADATSMLDISDGLAKDAGRIAKASGVTVQIDSKLLQGFDAALEQAAMRIGAEERDWVLFGGEDHSLLATFAADAILPREFKVIGRIIEAGDVSVLIDDEALPERGWDSVTG
jgi:thiamine-monophosphate kinase